MSDITKTALFAAVGKQLLSEYGSQLKNRLLLEVGERERFMRNDPQRTAR
jgi:hypothetical protein